MKLLSRALVAAAGLVAVVACSSSSNSAGGGTSSSGGSACQADPLKNDYCKACTVAANAVPATCKSPRTVNACCTFVAPPTEELARATGLHRYAATGATAVDLACLDTPGTVGTPKTVTLTGYVRLFSSGNDSVGVKIEIYKEGKDGALGDLVGTPVSTTSNDPIEMPKADWLKKCPDGGCSFRAYNYPGVPTETPLIIKTSDATNGAQWAPLYDYNIFFPTSQVAAGDTVSYEVNAVAATDLNTVASAAGGFTIKPDKGLLAGEVHDCGDVRLSGATVDTDAPHEGDMFYFGENESDPLPDATRHSTSKLGLFGTLNLPTGRPINISALGESQGKTVLLGRYTVQAYPGSVTALSLRGRRPWQQ